MKAIITYRPDSQKIKGSIRDSLTNDILHDMCQKVTYQDSFIVREDTSSYNKGRLVIIDYNGLRSYVTLSERKFEGRNSSLQSVPTALNIFCQDEYLNKQLCYYFLPHTGNAFTDYHLFMYRLMATAGMHFVNSTQYTTHILAPFINVDELIYAKRLLREANKSNNSSYVTKTATGVQIYAKVYGASKYESTLLAFATSKIAHKAIDLYNVRERDLKQLPQSSRDTLKKLNINFHDTPLYFDIKHQNETQSESLRSSAYIYNLLNKIGDKRCVLCGCPIQEIVQGAHVWNVADIKRSNLKDDDKFNAATNGNNGLWLCQNHHKLFDSNLIMIDHSGCIRIPDTIDNNSAKFIKDITLERHLGDNILNDEFLQYLDLRNISVDLSHSTAL